MSSQKNIPVTFIDRDSKAVKIRSKRVSKNLPKPLVAMLNKFAEDIDLDNFADSNAVIKRAYEIADKFMDGLSENIVCKKGCSHCCNQHVMVSAVEAQYMVSHGLEMAHPNEELLILKKDNISNIDKYDGIPCPLLDIDNGCCSQYEIRPLVCRLFAAIDNPKYCKNGSKHWILTAFSSPAFRSIQELFIEVSDKSTDIREWFPTVNKKG